MAHDPCWGASAAPSLELLITHASQTWELLNLCARTDSGRGRSRASPLIRSGTAPGSALWTAAGPAAPQRVVMRRIPGSPVPHRHSTFRISVRLAGSTDASTSGEGG